MHLCSLTSLSVFHSAKVFACKTASLLIQGAAAWRARRQALNNKKPRAYLPGVHHNLSARFSMSNTSETQRDGGHARE